MRGAPNGKRLLGQGLLDLALILAVLRQSDILDFSQHPIQDAYQRETFYDEGPLLGIVSAPVHHFQQHQSWGGLSQKSIDNHYDNIVDEYDNIMRDIRSRPPAMYTPPNVLLTNNRNEGHSSENNRSVITMILGIPSESSNAFRINGGVQVARNLNFQPEGAVGGVGIGLPYSADENFDLFNNYIPENMRDDDIDNLILSSFDGNTGNTVNNQTFSDARWQQFVSDFDNSFRGFKASNSSYGNWGNFDILNEAVQSAELFLPLLPNSQNTSGLDELTATNGSLNPGLISDDLSELVASSRLEMIETNEWGSQNHEADLLFPSLPPPSYDEVMASQQANSSAANVVQRERFNEHMHDHNYFNSSNPPLRVPESAQSTGYAIRSRHEVSTRVISVPPRPRQRHISDHDSSQSTSSEISEPADLTSEGVTRSSVRRITTSSDGSAEDIQQDMMSVSEYDELGSFEIRPLNSSLFENFTKDVGLRREGILCN